MSESDKEQGRVPRHIAIIMDGNRRFSKRLMLKPWKGHEWGAKKVEKLLDWCRELEIKELTLYTFSVQNFNRPKVEFDYLMNIFKKEFDRIKDDERIHKYRINLNFIGRLYMFPEQIQERMNALMDMTKDYNDYQVNFAMAYGGKSEVIDATAKIAKQVKEGKLDLEQINEETFSKNLYFDHEPDLIIRTGSEKRTSNFLIWQSSYSEWFFLEKMWPEFEKEDLEMAINEFSKRERRYGK
tara:strand:- start:364 stop:1083 length:720 start_codon:yes stop_codon:yes gene_type:complete